MTFGLPTLPTLATTADSTAVASGVGGVAAMIALMFARDYLERRRERLRQEREDRVADRQVRRERIAKIEAQRDAANTERDAALRRATELEILNRELIERANRAESELDACKSRLNR